VCDDTYEWYLNKLVYPSFLLWAFIIPGIIFVILFYRKRQKTLDDPKLRLALGGAYNEFNDRGFFWGTVLIALKLSIAFIGVQPTLDLKTKSLTVFILLFIVIKTLESFDPYVIKEIQGLEKLGHLVFMITVFFTLYYENNDYAII